MHIYSLEGNIGSGKSTLLEKLKLLYKNSPKYIFVDEPVDEWISTRDADDGLNILEKYYANQSKYAFSFQIFAYITKLRKLMNAIDTAPNDAILICERSLYTDRYVFAKMLYDSGKIEDINYSIYLNWYDYFINRIKGVRHFIYVSTSPEICEVRIRRRNRGGENSIPIDYLRECEKYHSEMISNLSNTVSCITLDGNPNKEDDSAWNAELDMINKFINSEVEVAQLSQHPSLGARLFTLDVITNTITINDFIQKCIQTLQNILSITDENLNALHKQFEANITQHVYNYIKCADDDPDNFKMTIEYILDAHNVKNRMYMLSVSIETSNNDKQQQNIDIIYQAIKLWCNSKNLDYAIDENEYVVIYV